MNLQTNAFDLGYVSQAVWYDAHGEPFRFTTVQGSNAVVEGVDLAGIRHPHWLLAFHVEPALLLLAPLYRLWPDARLLLWLQAALVAAGALPAAWLAGRLIGGWIAPVVFGLAYLLAPGLEGAALSDFHMVALGAAFLMAGLWLLETGRTGWALLCFAFTVLSREDAAAAVAWLGIVLLVRNWLEKPSPAAVGEGRVRVPTDRVAVAFAIGGGLWAALSIGLIQPLFSGGVSAFSARYAWLAAEPSRIAGWLAQPDVLAYVGLQLLTGGLVALLAPLELAAALPLLAVNVLSNFDWMRSGGGHYSALLVPLLVWAAVHGVRHLKLWGVALPGLALVLGSALGAQVWAGVSPLRPGFSWPPGELRAAQALASLAEIPPAASISATSALYPHLSARHDAFWFPAVAGAQWLALDVAGATHPLSPSAMREAALKELSRPGVEIAVARDGVLILQRTPNREGLLTDDPAERTVGAALRRLPDALPREFYGFATAAGPRTSIGPIRFGPALELNGYQLLQSPEVGLLGYSATLVTYWQVTAAIDQDLKFALATTRAADGALAGLRSDAAAAPLWLPTSHWRPGEEVRLDMSLGQVHGVRAAGVTVEDRAGRRLPVEGPNVELWDGGTIAAVARLG